MPDKAPAGYRDARPLFLALVGPLQSWSLSGPYRERTTHLTPTKSGVGLLAAALGRSREDGIHDLVALRLHLRVDRPGRKLRDFQTARGALRANGKADDGIAITRREYLEDAAFLAAMEGDAALLSDLRSAVEHPVYPMYLGRRDCLPSRPVLLAHVPPGDDVVQLFAAIPDLSGQGGRKQAYFEDPHGSFMVRDAPGRSPAVQGRLREAQWYERYL